MGIIYLQIYNFLMVLVYNLQFFIHKNLSTIYIIFNNIVVDSTTNIGPNLQSTKSPKKKKKTYLTLNHHTGVYSSRGPNIFPDYRI